MAPYAAGQQKAMGAALCSRISFQSRTAANLQHAEGIVLVNQGAFGYGYNVIGHLSRIIHRGMVGRPGDSRVCCDKKSQSTSN